MAQIDPDITYCAVGDLEIHREDFSTIFAKAAGALRGADISSAQLEQNFSDKGEQQYHETLHYHLRKASPKDIPALPGAGFKVLSVAGNHSLDWGPEAYLHTLQLLHEQGVATCGGGRNIDEARKPAILTVKGTRFAFLGYASVMPMGFEALENKPGCAPMRVHTVYREIDLVQPGSFPELFTYPTRADMEAMKMDVRKARAEADIVVVANHSGLRHLRATLADYQRDVAHAAIEAGADIVLNHHAHILKGIEVYNGKPIFYGLGNFAFDLPYNPELTARRNRLKQNSIVPIFQYDYERDPDYASYSFPPASRMTMIAKFIVRNNKLASVSFLPCYINKQVQPEVLTAGHERFDEVVQYVMDISREAYLDTKFRVLDNEVFVDIGQ